MNRPETDPHFEYLLRLGDSSLILGQRLAEWCGKAPILEEELALMNIGLDLIGQARLLLSHAGQVEGRGRDEDRLAFFRDVQEWRNLLLVEQENGDFAKTMARQFLFDTFQGLQYRELAASADSTLAEIAVKSLKEAEYHQRHSRNWMLRMGDGTEESHTRLQKALDELWGYVPELFEMDEVDQAMIAAGIGIDTNALRAEWDSRVREVLSEATLTVPDVGWAVSGSRKGQHTEHLGYLLAEMQFLPRAYPDARW